MGKKLFRLTVLVEFKDLEEDKIVYFSEFVGFYPTRAAVVKAMHRPELLHLAGMAAQRYAQMSDRQYTRTYKDEYRVHTLPADSVEPTYSLKDETRAMILAVSALNQIEEVPYGNI